MDQQYKWVDGEYGGMVIESNSGDYYAIRIDLKEELAILELRVSGTAVASQDCGLFDKDIHEWLWSVGLPIAKEMEEINFRPLLITSNTVQFGKLTTDWRNLVVV